MARSAVVRPSKGSAGVVGGPLIESRTSLAAARALLLGMGLIMMGNGLQSAVLGVRTEQEGFGLAVGGLIMAAYYLGFLLGTKMAETQLAAVGHVRVFAALASLSSTAAILHLVLIHPVSWAVLRFVFGLCMAGVFVTVESWLNDMSTPSNRGRILSMYMVVTMGGLSVGQLLLVGGDPGGIRLFIGASALISLALVPITLSATSSPPLAEPEPVSFRRLLSIVPTGVVTCFWTGVAHGTFLGVGALYAASEGLPASRIALFMAVPTLGAIAFQWPVGLISDRVSRRGVICAVALAAVATAAAMIRVDPGSLPSLALLFAFGGATFPLYSLALAYTADWLSPDQFNGGTAVMVRSVGVGAVAGPVIAGLAMAATAPWAFFAVLAAAHGVIALYVGGRILARTARPSEQGKFAPWPARASAMAANLVRKSMHRPRRKPQASTGPEAGS